MCGKIKKKKPKENPWSLYTDLDTCILSTTMLNVYFKQIAKMQYCT